MRENGIGIRLDLFSFRLKVDGMPDLSTSTHHLCALL